jgi:hypothetical protein
MKMGEVQGTETQEKPYIVVKNVTSGTVICNKHVLPGEKKENTVAVTLRPAEKVGLSAGSWRDDANIRQLVRVKAVKVFESDVLPDRMPELTAPPGQYLNNIERGAVHDIVFGNETQSASAIGVSPKVGDSETQINVGRLKTRNRDVLTAALYWFDLLHDWDREWDKDMVECRGASKRRAKVVNRIEEIDRIPMR